jgi:4-alpha-glucanotransferase
MLGSAVLWFTRDWEQPDQPFRPAADYPRNALASISTHDLPTAAGFLAGEQVRVRAELGQLTGSVEEEAAIAAQDRARLLERLADAGLIAADSTDEEIIVAMHEFLARTPCRFIAGSLYDVLGELAQPNLPGTTDEYPNWRMPLRSSVEDIVEDPRMRRIAAVLSERGLPSAPAGSVGPTRKERA